MTKSQTINPKSQTLNPKLQIPNDRWQDLKLLKLLKLAMIEIEKRGKLTKSQYEFLLKHFERKAKKVAEFERTTLVHIWRPDWQPGHQSAEAPFDLKIRTGGPKSSIAVKRDLDNKMHARHEFELEFTEKEFSKYLELLVNLGFGRFVGTIESRKKYKYKQFTIALFHHKTIDTYMIEAELMATAESETKGMENEIDKFFKEFKLSALNPEETGQILSELNNQEQYRFDFNKITTAECLARLGF